MCVGFSEAVAGISAGQRVQQLVLRSGEVSVSLPLHAVRTGLHQAEELGLRSSRLSCWCDNWLSPEDA